MSKHATEPRSNAEFKPLPALAPLLWLRAGLQDFAKAPVIGLFFGACFVSMGWLLWFAFQKSPAHMLSLSAGFLLLGPLLCMGLYRTSQQLERQERPTLSEAMTAWQAKLGTLAIFGGVLLVLEMLWARASLVVFAVALDSTMPALQPTLQSLTHPDNLDFVVTWLAVGGVFAGLIFSVAVVSIPMILDRGTDAITAGLTSLRLVLHQPLVLLTWGLCIALLTTLAMLPGFAGLLVVGPVLGHASWHAYRQALA